MMLIFLHFAASLKVLALRISNVNNAVVQAKLATLKYQPFTDLVNNADVQVKTIVLTAPCTMQMIHGRSQNAPRFQTVFNREQIQCNLPISANSTHDGSNNRIQASKKGKSNKINLRTLEHVGFL